VRFSVVIPVRNDPRVRDVVAALLPQAAADGEILVADDGTPGALPSLPGAQVVPVHAHNPGIARNAAAARARGEILLFTDADVVLPADWVAIALAAFEDPDVPAIQGMSRAVGDSAVTLRVQEEYDRFVRSHASSGSRDFCDSRCFGIRREVFERFSFDAADAPCEDAALGRRLFEAGLFIRFVPRWGVGHLFTDSVIFELGRLRRYAAASRRHQLRTARDLFRSPGDPPARGPGAALLRLADRHPVLGPPAGHGLWIAALAAGAGARIPAGIGRGMFQGARRAAVLSARLHPGRHPNAEGPRVPVALSALDTIAAPPPSEEHAVPSNQTSPNSCFGRDPDLVTVVVVPRERFGLSLRSLDTLYRNTDFPFRLVYVDGGSPPAIARALADAAAARGFDLVRTEGHLSPNEARNLGFARASGRYAVFVDNDLLVEPGWLAALVRCADETGADVVGPLYGIGEPQDGIVHMAGGIARIEEKDGQRYLSEIHRFAGRRVAEVEADLKREPTELVEFHCLLVRTETQRAIGALDEELLSTGEHIDLCLTVRERGGTVYFEPASRVSYVPPPPLDPSDRAFFRVRWSEAWTRRSLARLTEKWNLSETDPYMADHVRWLRSHRRLPLRSAERFLDRSLGRTLARPLKMSLAAAERAWNLWSVPSRRLHEGSVPPPHGASL
jgi:glycosyltransferase involved in cell wall biosynthesis